MCAKPRTETEDDAVTNEVVTNIFSAITPRPSPPKVLPTTTLAPLIYHITATKLTTTTTLLTFLTTHTDLTKPCIEGLTQLGAVYLHYSTSQRCSPRAVRQSYSDLSKIVPCGRIYVRVHVHPKRYNPLYKPFIICEVMELGLVVVHKPAGIPCCASVDNMKECVTGILGTRVTTRLDVGTSGVLVMSWNVEGVITGNRLLKTGEKYYVVFCEDVIGDYVIEKGVWRDWYNRGCCVGRGYRDGILRRWEEGGGEDWVEAMLEIVEVLCVNSGVVVVVKLGTGRTHQIRLQMAARGICVVGDWKYREVVGRVYDGGWIGGDANLLGLHCWLVGVNERWFRAEIERRKDLMTFVGDDCERLMRFLEVVERRIRKG